jgi:hypothetical protein
MSESTEPKTDLTASEAKQRLEQLIFQELNHGNAIGNELDKSILALSGGALGISLTFHQQFNPNCVGAVFLFLSWICFAFAILLVLFGMRESQRHSTLAVEKFFELLKPLQVIPAQSDFRFTLDLISSPIKTIRILNLGSIALFSAGVFLLAVVAVIGINGSLSGESPQNQNTREIVTESPASLY